MTLNFLRYIITIHCYNIIYQKHALSKEKLSNKITINNLHLYQFFAINNILQQRKCAFLSNIKGLHVSNITINTAISSTNHHSYNTPLYSSLITCAKQAMQYAYCKYSNFKVGSAIATKDGSIFTGCNVENSSYGATMCAERTAVFKAVSEGNKDFVAIAIVSSNDEFTYPCGMCRQVLSEFNLDLIIVLSQKDQLEVTTLRQLLPHAFISF